MASVAVQAQEHLTPRFRSFGPGNLSGGLPSDDFGDGSLGYREEQKPWRVSGGMQLSPFVSLELGYQNFPGNGNSTGNALLDTTAWSFSGLLSLPLDSGIAPYARLGQMFWDANRSTTDLPSSPDGGRDLYYGLGLRFGLAEQLGLNFEYERFSQNETELDMGSMNLNLSF